jgi:tRNA dimethylallyltransferase
LNEITAENDPTRCWYLTGATAVGKTAVALELAGRLGAEVLSLDSMAVYRGMDIGTAKPSPEQQLQVPHHLIDVVDPDGSWSAAQWAQAAALAIEGILARGRLPLVVGGTGLYLRALIEGLFEGPSRRPELRARLEALAERHGDARLHRRLANVDPGAAARIPPRDRVRVVRALEVWLATGQPISAQQPGARPAIRDVEVLTLGLSPEREALREAIEQRTARMLEAGLLEEVAGLLARGYRPELRPLQAIGYREAVQVVRGELEPAEARRRIVTATLRYAKRQRTWFRHQARVEWCASAAQALERAREWLRGGSQVVDVARID